MGTTRLFVYGTLKRGGRAHWLVAGQRFVGTAVTEPRYRLHDIGGYPGLMADDAAGLAVAGELWDVDADRLAEIDAYEFVPDEYVRGPVALHDGSTAGAYFYNRTLPAGARTGASWPFGAVIGSGGT